MPTITFRFTTECEMTLQDDSYEAAYLRFKDFMHSQKNIDGASNIAVYPPASEHMFFHIDKDSELYEIPFFKGGFAEDIASNCRHRTLQSPQPLSTQVLSQRVRSFIPDFYW